MSKKTRNMAGQKSKKMKKKQNRPKSQRGEAPALIKAAHAGQAGQLRWLLERGADPHARDRFGGSDALMAAAHGGSLECVKLLLAHGADFTRKDDAGQDALKKASFSHSVDDAKVIGELLSAWSAHPDGEERSRMAFFEFLAQGVDDEAIALEFAKRVDVNARIFGWKTPLTTAAGGRQWCCVEALLDVGADANGRDSMGRTPLSIMVGNGPRVASEALIAAWLRAVSRLAAASEEKIVAEAQKAAAQVGIGRAELIGALGRVQAQREGSLLSQTLAETAPLGLANASQNEPGRETPGAQRLPRKPRAL